MNRLKVLETLTRVQKVLNAFLALCREKDQEAILNLLSSFSWELGCCGLAWVKGKNVDGSSLFLKHKKI